MTKYEWDTELKKNIHRLPVDEIKRVLEYYGELFEDMAERGKSEREIINEFGNPVDVADKILSEYEGELENIDAKHIPTDNNHIAYEPNKQSEENCQAKKTTAPENPDVKKTSTEQDKSKNITGESGNKRRRIDYGRLVLFIMLNIFTGGAMFIVIGVVWIVLAAFVLSGAVCVVGGGVAVLSSFAVMSTGHAGAGIAQFGVGVAVVGFGMLMAVECVILIILYARLNKRIFGLIRKLLTVKEG